MINRTRDNGRHDLARVAGLLALAALLLVLFRGRFHHTREMIEYPAVPLALGLLLAGLVFLRLVPLIRAAGAVRGRPLARQVCGMVVVGLGLRLLMLFSTPALEDDFYRYLWDGGMVVAGYNPFRIAPSAADEDGTAPAPVKALAEAAGDVHARINHPDIKTIYPPVAQAAFALAHLIEPWSLLAWRLVCLTGELATLALLLALLAELGRSPLWAALYWWNPIVIKELANSAHMEAVLMPLVLGAVLLAVRRRPVAATGMLALAVGTKLWPVLLAPVIWRPLLATPWRLAIAIGILAGACVLWALPPWLGIVDETSGFVAYATYWKTNSALMPTLERLVGLLAKPWSLSPEAAGRVARGLAGGVLLAFVVRQAWEPIAGAEDLIRRATLVVACLYLLSPAQFPWYLVWLQPFLALRPIRGWLLATPLVAIYYASFYFHARDISYVFKDYVVWAIWLPIWAVLIHDTIRYGSGQDQSEKGLS